MNSSAEFQDDFDWATRNEHWLARQGRPRGYRSKRTPKREPLILCGNSVTLRIDKGALLVKDGFTHYPQQRAEYRFFKGTANLPSRIVMLDGSGSLSFDVITWLSEQSIPLVRLDYQGNAVSVIGGSGYAANPATVQWQIETRADPERRMVFCRDLIARKFAASLKTLNEVIPDTKARSAAIVAAENGIHRLRNGDIGTVEDLRMLEAAAAGRYFAAWKGLPLIWRSRWKYPIPDEWLVIAQRNSVSKAGYISNRNAKHPVNAMLNYAYGMLYSEIHIQSVAEGFDPRRGIMHHDRDDAAAFPWLYDMVEPRRPEVDAAVLKFALATPFTGADFVVASTGVCRLGPQLARAVASLFT